MIDVVSSMRFDFLFLTVVRSLAQYQNAYGEHVFYSNVRPLISFPEPWRLIALFGSCWLRLAVSWLQTCRLCGHVLASLATRGEHDIAV
jgi:hypothetical protein